MAHYVSISDMRLELPRLPQTTTASGFTVTTDIITGQIIRAENYVHGYLARRYSVPFVVAPPFVKTITLDIAAFRIYRSLYGRDTDGEVHYEESYRRAQSDLFKLQKGQLDLINSSGALYDEKDVDDKIFSTTENYAPFFNVDDPTAWKFDDDQLEAVQDDR